MTAIKYRTANVDGIGIFYREAGSPAAPKLLLLHGFPSAGHMFRDLIPLLADGFHIVAPDLPGFGNSDMPGRGHSFDRIAEEFRHQYVVGFNPNCNHKNNKPHRIQVKLAQRSALAADSKKISIRHREEYKPGLALNKK